jgi:hypothetical protein
VTVGQNNPVKRWAKRQEEAKRPAAAAPSGQSPCKKQKKEAKRKASSAW